VSCNRSKPYRTRERPFRARPGQLEQDGSRRCRRRVEDQRTSPPSSLRIDNPAVPRRFQPDDPPEPGDCDCDCTAIIGRLLGSRRSLGPMFTPLNLTTKRIPDPLFTRQRSEWSRRPVRTARGARPSPADAPRVSGPGADVIRSSSSSRPRRRRPVRHSLGQQALGVLHGVPVLRVAAPMYRPICT